MDIQSDMLKQDFKIESRLSPYIFFMKKLILSLSILVLTLVSCSNEETQLTESNISTNSFNLKSSSGNAKIDALYDQMINSPEYLAEKTARESFYKKINFTGTVDDARSDEKLLNWIGNNLSSTGFSSLTEAENELGNLKNLSGETIRANWSFYQEVGTQLNPGQTIYLLEQPEPVSAQDDCGCKKQLISDLTDAADVYINDMNAVDYGGDYYEAISTIYQARDCFTLLCQQARQNYSDCIYRCNNSDGGSK